MLDNDEPWKPPEMQKTAQLQLKPQVPELTIISTENKSNSKSNNNFLQRAMLTEKNLKTQAGCTNQTSPSVRFQPVFPNKSPANNAQDTRTSPILTRPQVPDITILDDDETNNNRRKSNSTEKVFTNSYKEMLINSHDQFLKQLQREAVPQASNKTNEHNIPLAKYRQNPLTKYIPSPEQQNFNKFKDGNSSSILSDIDITQNNNVNTNSKNGETEEVTFKKVAEMLSEIQKLVVTEKPLQVSSPNSNSGNIQQPKSSSNHEILRQLAKTYLTPEELAQYQVDSELSELEV